MDAVGGLDSAGRLCQPGQPFLRRRAAEPRPGEVALRTGAGSDPKVRILRTLFTEAALISLMGGAVGLWGSVMLLGGPEHVAANAQISYPCACDSGRKCL